MEQFFTKLKDLKQYRSFVFPPQFAQENNQPYFGLNSKDQRKWITTRAVECFKTHIADEDGSVSEVDLDEEDPQNLEEYRSFILPEETLSHTAFSLENATQWVKSHPFRLFMGQRKLGSEAAAMTVKQEFPSLSAKAQVSRKRKVSESVVSENHDIIYISSDSERSEPNTQPSAPKKQAKSRKPSTKRRKLIPEPSEHSVRITIKESVNQLVVLDHIPTIWDVSSGDGPTAYLVDLSAYEDGTADSKSIISMIRGEEQSSWSGSGGHANGDASVINHFGPESVRCRRADLKCNGIKKCEYIDPMLLDGFESWERDDSEMAPFWELQLDDNEAEFCDPDGPLSRFYLRAHQKKCKVACDGKPVIRKLKKASDTPKMDITAKSIYGKNTFVGCSGWRSGDDRDAHRYLPIEKALDESLVASMLKNNGKLPVVATQPTLRGQSTCSLLVHPRSHKQLCPYTHNIDGEVKQGNIIPHDKCKSHLIIYEPIDKTIRKAIVIPMHPHNHPRHPHAKPTQREKDFVRAASNATGLARVSAKKLRTSATTAGLLDPGQSWESQVPGMVNDDRLRKFIRTLKNEKHPRGLDWDGLHHYVEHEESKLPQSERYIHTVTTKGDIRLVVTMHPAIAKHIHSVRYLALDYTFKRVRGDMNEWEVAGTIDRYQTRVTFASLYCNKATREAFRIIFQEFFDVIHRVTGSKLDFAAFNPDAKLCALLFDAEAAQMQACGDVLLGMNNPELSGITTHDPLILIQYFAKTCVQHFLRNIDELPRNIPRDVIDRLKAFPSIASDDEMEEWHMFCKFSPFKPITNWYKQKIMHPWYLPSVNRFLSPMPAANWDMTPDDTNVGESAHAARNAETGIGMPLLAAILDARHFDEKIKQRLDHYESSYTLGNPWNGPLERAKRNASRRENTQRKINSTTSARGKYDALNTEMRALLQKRQELLEHGKTIDKRIGEIHAELPNFSAISTISKNLKSERTELKAEERRGVEMRKEYTYSIQRLKAEMKALKENELANSRVRDSRPSSSPAPHTPSKLSNSNFPVSPHSHHLPSSPLKSSHVPNSNGHDPSCDDDIYVSAPLEQGTDEGLYDPDDIYVPEIDLPIMHLSPNSNPYFNRFFELYPEV